MDTKAIGELFYLLDTFWMQMKNIQYHIPLLILKIDYNVLCAHLALGRDHNSW